MLTMEEIIYTVKNSEAKFMIIHPLIMQKAKLTRESAEKALGITLIVLDKELLRYMKERLAAYKLPRTIEFVPSLPKNSTGKIMKRILKEQQADKN